MFPSFLWDFPSALGADRPTASLSCKKRKTVTTWRSKWPIQWEYYGNIIRNIIMIVRGYSGDIGYYGEIRGDYEEIMGYWDTAHFSNKCIIYPYCRYISHYFLLPHKLWSRSLLSLSDRMQRMQPLQPNSFGKVKIGYPIMDGQWQYICGPQGLKLWPTPIYWFQRSFDGFMCRKEKAVDPPPDIRVSDCWLHMYVCL